MKDKAGRNDPCPCGSGKKFKNCCLLKEKQRTSSLGGRKFTAKVLSAGGMHKAQTPVSQEQEQSKQVVDYATLMERSFGEALHSYDEKPPLPQNPAEYVVKDDMQEKS